MKIAVIGIRGIPANYGGFEVTAENIAKRLARRGHRVTVYCRGSGKAKLHRYLDMRLIYLPSLELPHLSTPSHSTISAIDAIFHSYDAIFAFNVGNALPVLFMRIFGKKSVLFVDGLDWKRDKYGAFGKWFLKKSEALAEKVSSHIVVDALSAQKHYLNKYGKNVHFIPSGADIVENVEKTGILEKFGLEPKKYVISIGRLTQEKRQHLIVEAFKKVKTDMKLVIVGGNPYNLQYVNKISESAKGDDRIIVAGSIYGNETDELYFNSAVFVNASKIEGTSLSLLQAMGNGNALLVSDIPENHSAVHDCALEFKVDDFDDFVEKFDSIVNDKSLREKLSQRAKKVTTEYYSWDIATDKFEALLLDAAGIRNSEKKDLLW
ncbi:glycosyltransferase family 4 protein [bacterium]|nr:glycosyltransferase family 4 protein [bacterium]